MRLYFTILFICLALFLSDFSCHKESASGNDAALASDILQLINQYRKSIGKSELKANDVIEQEAYKHSFNMAHGKVPFSHDGFDGRYKRVQKKLGVGSAAENVAYGYKTAQDVVNGWLTSPGHKKNIEGDYFLTGIGIALSDDGTPYYTQFFYNSGYTRTNQRLLKK